MTTEEQAVIGYHFVGKTLRGGLPVPPDGEWLHHSGEIELCCSGYHGSLHPFDALQYAPGTTLCLCEFGGQIIHCKNILVARSQKIVKRINAEQLLRGFARECALSVVHLWDCPDVVRTYLETGDGSLREAARSDADAAAWAAWVAAEAAVRAAACAAARAAACAAAWSTAWAAADTAAWAAARDAARPAARDAAWSTARAAHKDRFLELVNNAFSAVV